jgi:iodotyrosine deiodinase
MSGSSFIPYSRPAITDEKVLEQSTLFYIQMKTRRSVRHFSDRPVADEVLDNIILTAGTAPSGAHKQPWHFCVVRDPETRRKIREAAEKEEYESYNGRMTEEWLRDLQPLGTVWQKPFLEITPALIVVFRKPYELVDGVKKNNYYVNESVGLACGFLLAAIHQAGLVSLTHTPSPMNFLSKVLNRPENEKPYLLIPVGHPGDGCEIPDLHRKSLNEIATRY